MTTAKHESLSKVGKIDGWLSQNEASLLYDLARDATGPIVEIGSWRGRSTSALALGSMNGNQQPLYAIDSFIGITAKDRPTAFGEVAGLGSSSYELLRSNLDSAGINGLVRIVPKASQDAATEVPAECGLLFVDGAHDYKSVKRDIELYSPKVKTGGLVVLHDCHEADPGVAKAADELLTAQNGWRCRWRMDTAVVFERRPSVRHTVMLGFPGGEMCYGAHKGLRDATLGAHEVYEEQSGIGWDDMNRLWCYALNQAHKGKITHFAMLHSDIMPSPGWIDLLIDELDDRKADFISAVAALKNDDGLTSCGIGDADNQWEPHRRFTMRELVEMPETFAIEDTPHPDRYLLHNTGCWVADLRSPLWRVTKADGSLLADFSFPIRAAVLPTGEIVHQRESEDWHFSRMMALLGCKTLCTRRVATVHYGQKGFRNDRAWGRLEHDDATQAKWGAK